MSGVDVLGNVCEKKVPEECPEKDPGGMSRGNVLEPLLTTSPRDSFVL